MPVCIPACVSKSQKMSGDYQIQSPEFSRKTSLERVGNLLRVLEVSSDEPETPAKWVEHSLCAMTSALKGEGTAGQTDNEGHVSVEMLQLVIKGRKGGNRKHQSSKSAALRGSKASLVGLPLRSRQGHEAQW